MQENNEDSSSTPISNTINISHTPPAGSTTQGEGMFTTYLKGFGGTALQVIGGFVAISSIFYTVLEGDSEGVARLVIGIAMLIYGGFLRYKSKQTVQIGGSQTTRNH